MKSLRWQITLLTVCAIVVTLLFTAVLGIVALRDTGNRNSEQLLLSLCENGQKNLDYYFENAEQSVDMVATYVESDLSMISKNEFPEHLKNVKNMFYSIAQATQGVLTYYYRVDPAFSETEKGFWFVNLDGKGFKEHEVTDISQYDTNDTSQLVWFSVPKNTGEAVWLAPYITDNLDKRVISYNEPIYWDGRFVGVIGVEIDYSTMAEQVDNIKLYEHGYAFINDAEGTIIYHPLMDVTTMTEQPKVPNGLLSSDKFIHYSFEGEDKQAVWLPLHNGMHLNVCVPVSEINAGWHKWVWQIIIISVILLALFIFITYRYANHITKPLRELTAVAEEVDKGNYDCKLEYDGEDEVGILTRSFRKLIGHLKTYIGDLNDLAYVDALTSVSNKGAFNQYIQVLESEVSANREQTGFAICVFDCNGLKKVNDIYGHAKGDAYLKASSHVICEAFSHSQVFRIGGDEFAVILRNVDYERRNSLLSAFDEICAERCSTAKNEWEKVSIARGMAEFDPETDDGVEVVLHRADKRMYEHKWKIKNGKNENVGDDR